MRYRILFSVAAIVLVLSISAVPRLVLSAVPQVTVEAASEYRYSESILCTGEIVPKTVREIYAACPVYPSEVLVSVGDVVEAGEALAIIDTEMSSAILREFSGGGQSVFGNGISEGSLPEDFLAQYGLDSTGAAALLNGYAESGSLYTEKTEYPPYDIPAVLTAPIGGVVGEINLSTGVLSNVSDALFVIIDNTDYGVRLSVGEGDVARVREGDRILVTGSAVPDEEFEAVLTKIYPTARKALTGTTTETVVDVEAEILNPSENLRAGYSAKGRILLSEEAPLVAVPYEAVRQDSDNVEYVYVYQGGVAMRRDIETGLEFSKSVEVLRGLEIGETVVTEPGILQGERQLVLCKREGEGP